MIPTVQRAGDRVSGGGMTGLKGHNEWPCELSAECLG